MLHDTKYATSQQTSQKESFTENKIKKTFHTQKRLPVSLNRFHKIGETIIGHSDHNQPKPVASKTHWWGKIPTDNGYYVRLLYHFKT
jgi:hypothetical protein